MIITIYGRRWFDKVNGNTYHSCRVDVDGRIIGVNQFEYGYDNQYIESGFEILKRLKVLKAKVSYSDFRNNRIKNIMSSFNVADVARRSDLKFDDEIVPYKTVSKKPYNVDYSGRKKQSKNFVDNMTKKNQLLVKVKKYVTCAGKGYGIEYEDGGKIYKHRLSRSRVYVGNGMILIAGKNIRWNNKTGINGG